jgi:hypothetical protein
MSDFLLNLLTRSFQPAMEIQPLATSAFAPPISARRNLAFGAEQTEDAFAQPSADDRSAENERVLLGGDQTIVPAEGDCERALVTETQLPQKTLPSAVAITPSAKSVVGQAPLPTGPVIEDQHLFSSSETVAQRVRPHENVVTSLSEPVIQPVDPRARLPKARQLFETEPAPRPAQILVVHETKSVSDETPPPFFARLGQPPTTKGIASDRNSSPLPKQTSVNRLFAAQPGVKNVIIERVTGIAEKTAAVSDARRTLIPKSIAAPPLVANFNKRSKPQSAPIVQEPDTLPPETVINVTIGRIEVRATPPAAPKPARQRGASSVMGLDEYLRQRNGSSEGPGGRR